MSNGGTDFLMLNAVVSERECEVFCNFWQLTRPMTCANHAYGNDIQIYMKIRWSTT